MQSSYSTVDQKLALIRQVEKKVREKFVNESANKLEDKFDEEKYQIAEREHDEIENIVQQLGADDRLSYLELNTKIINSISQFTSGPCQIQTGWALAQYIR